MKQLLFGGELSAQKTSTSLGLLALRLGAGITLMFGHGLGKLSSFGTLSAKFADVFLTPASGK